MSALLIARLRFERLLRGDRVFARAWDEEPETTAGRFTAYHRKVALWAFSPWEEAALFRRWEAEGW